MPLSRLEMNASDLEFSRFAFGFWRLMDWNRSPAEVLDLIHALLDLGVTTFDHADIYGDYQCEAAFGAALALEPALRDRIEIVTKCGIKLPSWPGNTLPHYDTTKAHILQSVENSLQRLRVETIDVLLIHRPDPFMDADETAAAFEALHQSGKVRYFGVSNFLPAQFDLLQSRLELPLVTNQVEFSVMHLDPLYDGTFDQMQRLHVAPQAWSPLAGGRLFTGEDERTVRVRETLMQVGNDLGGYTLDQVALAWILAHPVRVQPVIGTGKLERVRSAVAAANLTLSREQWFTILRASHGHDVP